MQAAAIDRRSVLRFFCRFVPLFALHARTAAAGPLCAVDRLAGAAGEQGKVSFSRRYRVSAVVTLFSVPIFSRHDVGGGYAAVERTGDNGNGTVALQFSAGSWPKQVHGLNRFGFQQEAVVETGGVATESAEFGFMTSSPEGNIQQARSSFTNSPGQLPCVMAHASYTREGCMMSIERLALPARYSWSDCAELQRQIRGDLGDMKPPAHARVNKDRAFPFLFAVHQSMLHTQERFQTTFQHNGECHQLETVRQRDKDMGRTLKARGIASDENAVIVLSGLLRNQKGEKTSEFRIWFENAGAAGPPLRIEFRPRSFLHLVFESDPSVGGPQITYLMPRRDA